MSQAKSTHALHRPSLDERAQDPAALDATCVLKLGYRGNGFAGFAAQPTQRTVAGELSRALSTFLHRDIELSCAGRTDAGVHASAQYVSVPVTSQERCIPAARLMRALTALVPADMTPLALWAAPRGFSARFDALSRSYRYRICTGEVRPVLMGDYVWWQRAALDLAAMQKAAQLLLGEHDFKSFCKASSAQGKTTVRELLQFDISESCELGESLICCDIKASAFLHSMVRTMVGTLVEVGKHHKDPAWTGEVLAACDRRAAGQCAPAKGLTFIGVDYPAGLLAPW